MHMYISCTPSIRDVRFSSTHEFIFIKNSDYDIIHMYTGIVYTGTSA